MKGWPLSLVVHWWTAVFLSSCLFCSWISFYCNGSIQRIFNGKHWLVHLYSVNGLCSFFSDFQQLLRHHIVKLLCQTTCEFPSKITNMNIYIFFYKEQWCMKLIYVQRNHAVRKGWDLLLSYFLKNENIYMTSAAEILKQCYIVLNAMYIEINDLFFPIIVSPHRWNSCRIHNHICLIWIISGWTFCLRSLNRLRLPICCAHFDIIEEWGTSFVDKAHKCFNSCNMKSNPASIENNFT